jgi:hypothetical protein
MASRMIAHYATGVAAAVLLAALPLAAGAQGVREDGRGHSSAAPDRALAVVGGAFQYDLSGTGTTGFGGVRLEWPLARYFLAEPGLTYARYTPQGVGGAVSLLFPEVQLQLVRPGGLLRPFVGVGAGPALALGGGASESELALSAGAGLRMRLAPEWSGRAELRLRAIDPWTGSAAEWTIGLARRL